MSINRYASLDSLATEPRRQQLLGVQYLRSGRRSFTRVTRVNVERLPSYSIFSVLRYTTGVEHRTRLYLALQALNTARYESRSLSASRRPRSSSRRMSHSRTNGCWAGV